MLNWYTPVEGHHETCLINFGPRSDGLCDCGASVAALNARIADAEAGRVAACEHKWTGFRDAKVCAKCHVPKREWKAK